MHSLWSKFKALPLKYHLFFAFVVRVLFVLYGWYHDTFSSVKYTDVDYNVFTDASRHILKGNSPYDRHTYRYSPIVAILLIPNITIHHLYGKFLFCVIDIIVGVLIHLIVLNNFLIFDYFKKNNDAEAIGVFRKAQQKSSKQIISYEHAAKISALIWLYNPFVIAISTRGNCDSLAGFIILSMLYFMQCKKQYFISGLFYGTAIHFRLYPIIYSLTLYIFCSEFASYTDKNQRLKNINAIELIKSVQYSNFKSCKSVKYLLKFLPNLSQFKLIAGTTLSLFVLTVIFYYIYGYTFLYETYLFHLFRQDVKHNFSLFFYVQYITAFIKNISVWQKLLINLPKIVLLLVVSFHYGSNKFAINFAILVQTVIMVIYNTVLTSQYFVWIMAILPLCIWQINISRKELVISTAAWFFAQLAWLLPAYLLEFRGRNTFIFIWIQSVSFFCVNIAILGRFVKNFVVSKEKML